MNYILLLLAISLTRADSELIDAYDKVILHSKVIVGYNATASSPNDGNHTKALTFGGGLYDQAGVDQFRYDGINWLTYQFGVNFSQGTLRPIDGALLLPGVGTLIAYATGDDFATRYIFDSTEKKVGKDNNWIVFKVGVLAVLSSTGTFPPGCVMAGTPFSPGDVIGFTYNNYLEVDHQEHWKIPGTKWRRIINVRSEEVSKTFTNYQGLSDTFGKEIFIECRTAACQIADQGNKGYNAVHVTQRKDSNGVITYRAQSFATFPDIIHY